MTYSFGFSSREQAGIIKTQNTRSAIKYGNLASMRKLISLTTGICREAIHVKLEKVCRRNIIHTN
jgi:hypothetical protein